MYDAVHVFAKALHQVDLAQAVQIQPLSCNKERSWQDGESFFNYMKMVHTDSCSLIIILILTFIHREVVE